MKLARGRYIWYDDLCKLTTHYVPVAQLDRALACGAKGRRFESCRVHHYD